MKIVKTQKAYLVAMVIMGVFISILSGCGGGGGGSWNQPMQPVITAYSLAGVTGTINEPARTIAVTVPFGTNVTALVATFTTTGVTTVVGSTPQLSGTTPNNFSSPVVYTVTAADNSTATYSVTVTIAPNFAKAITAYSFVGFSGIAGTINEPAKTIAVTVPYGTDLSNLVAAFTTTGTSVKVGATVQTSGTSQNTFSGPVVYTVSAADGSSVNYNVTVTVAPSSLKAITAYSFVGFSGFAGTVNESAKTIAVTLPFGTNVSNLIALFTTTGTGVKVTSVVQVSGTTPNNFIGPVAYLVTAADGSTTTYNVTVTVAPSSLKAITAYSFVGFSGFAGTINESAKTIAVNLPFGTDVTNLIATFTITGTVAKIGTTVQTSTATANNFTSPVAYIVTAADGSTATYTVTVTKAPNSAKAITAYSFVGFSGFPGTVNESAKTIAVNLPFGTNVTNLVAAFTTTGVVVKVGAAVQTSTATPNNFITPVAYIVSAVDGSTATYNVTVTVAQSSLKAITAYSFVGFSGFAGTINESAKTIVVNLPSGADVTSLIATFTTTGIIVSVGPVVQTSTATLNNFASPVAYTVTAADGSTATYFVTVNVTAPLSSLKAITAYSYAGFSGAIGTINESAKTIAVTVPFGTDVTSLTATFTTTGTVVTVGAAVQTSTATINNFSGTVAYVVSAADGTTATYAVTVSQAPNSAKAITAYSYAGFSGATGIINESAKTIAVTVPFGTDVTSLTATFTTTGTVVKVGAAVQTSAATINNFTFPVSYIVSAADGTSVTYSVTVTLAPNSAKAITAYSFVGFGGFPATINESAKTVIVYLPLGTDVTNLIATFTTTGTIVKKGAVVQTSGATINDFTTTPLAYTVVAADASTATYSVIVIMNAPALGAASPFGGFGGNATLTNDGLNTVINGDIGVNASSTKITGLRDSGANVYTITPNNDGMVTGLIYTLTAPPGSVAGATVTQARADALAAFIAISPAKLPGGIDVSSLAQCPSCGGAGQGPGQLAGRTLPPGVYLSTTGTYGIGITAPTAGNLTLDAGGDPDAVWVFQTAAGTGALTVGLTGPATPAVPIQILFKNGIGKPKNVYWYLPAGATIGTGSTMVGTMLADAAITMSTTGGTPPTAVITTLNGRAICLTAGVTITNTVINVPAP